jgi:Domain of unknown function (DUF892)
MAISLRGSGGEEKVLKNAKDACAAEALEIATYTALVRLATAVGDDVTATLAASILAEEEKMLARVMREIPKLTDAVVRAEVKGKPSYDVTKTGAADAAKDASRTTGAAAKRTARRSRKVPASLGSRVTSRARSRLTATSRLPATTRSPPRRSPAACPSSHRSISTRSTRTSARVRTARPCSAASRHCRALSRGPATTS